jgi:tetratricopeptide (TPR) repeat protein
VQGVLDDLGAGISLNEALPRRTKMSLKELDDHFARFARERANNLGANVTWEEPPLPADADSAAIDRYLEKNPKSFNGWRRFAARLIEEGNLGRARGAIKTLKSMYPEYVGPENAYMLQAVLCRKQSDPAGERASLEELVARDGSASPAYLRLLELEEAARDWKGLTRDSQRLLAINPLIPAPYRALAHASEQLGATDEALSAYRGVVVLDESDPADIHYRLARLLQKQGKRGEARREVLKSLEEAPRFQDGLKLLLELVESPGDTTNPSR